MDDQPLLDSLLSRETDRKEFLLYLGSVSLALFGVSALIRTLTDSGSHQKRTHGYGSGSYGGRK